jgi:hypothetical protein
MHSTRTAVAPPHEPWASSAGALALSVILPVIDETTSLRETVRILLAENSDVISEILLIVCKRTTQQALDVCLALTRENPQVIRTCSQKRPYLG